jgi:hypothetical protein
MGRETSFIGQNRFWQISDNYHGVIASDDPFRLAVSPNGKRYVLQVPWFDKEHGLTFWALITWRKSLSKLLPDVPARLAAKLPDDLPDDPAQFVRPWADEIEATRRRFRQAIPIRDEFAGVIAKGDVARLVWLPPVAEGASGGRKARPARYAFQAPYRGKWRNVTTARKAPLLRAVLTGSLEPSSPGAVAAGDPILSAAVEELPEEASEYRGRVVETLAALSAEMEAPRPVAPPFLNARQRRETGLAGSDPRQTLESASSARKSASPSMPGAKRKA